MLAPNVVNGSLDAFKLAAHAIQPIVFLYARSLFVLLAVIGGAYEFMILALERADIATWGGAAMRRVLFVLTFWTFLLYGPGWAVEIVSSLEKIGVQAGGSPGADPQSILTVGADISTSLLSASATYGFLTGQFTVGLTLVISAIMIRIAFSLIALQVAVTLVLWYIVGSLGVIFLGFGGSRWTAPYVERYFSMAVAMGIKFLTIMFLVGIGMQFGPILISMAQTAPQQPNPAGVALDILSAAGLLALTCWQVPKVFATLMSGSPSMGAGEVYAGVSAMITGAMAAGGAAMAGAGLASKAAQGVAQMASRAGGASGGASQVAAVQSAGSSSVAPTWNGPGSASWSGGGASAGGGSNGGGSSASPSNGSAPSNGGGGGNGGGGNGGGGAARHARAAVSNAQQALRGLGDDGGGHSPSGPGFGS